jgi:hypothetical protein
MIDSMTRSTRRVRAVAAIVPLVLLAAAGLPGTLAAQALPTAEEITARYVAAIGGRDVVLRPRASRSTGTFEMAGAGLKGGLVIVMEAPNRMVSQVTIPGMGEILSGFDGGVGWSVEPMQGPRLLAGAELDELRENANMLAQVRDASLFRSMETVERTASVGEPCYRVKLVWQSGRETFDCYHVDTGLLIATTAETDSPMGAMAVTTRLTDYRDFAGMMVPTRLVLEMMGTQQVLTISTVEFDDVDTSLIEPPAAIRVLMTSGR